MALKPSPPVPAPKSTIVEAVGAATANSDVGKRMEEAMSAAILAANAEGITDSETLRARMTAAREKVKAEARTR